MLRDETTHKLLDELQYFALKRRVNHRIPELVVCRSMYRI